MPKSVEVTEEERIFILKSIEETFGLKINSVSDCELLSQIIFKETNNLISYNTLRRFFKILPNTNFPSLYTVNVLSKLIGFKDYVTLKAYRLNLIRDFVHENLHLISISKSINKAILEEIIPLLHEAHWENIYQIRSLIDLFIKKDRADLIKLFLDKDIDESNWELLYKYYVAFQPIHAAAKSNNRPVIDFIKQNINDYKIIQQVLLQLYVEEDNLELYYGEWINACTIYLTSDMEIFSTCIKIQYHFIKIETTLLKVSLSHLNSLIKDYKNKIHPILLGRIAAWNFIINEDSSYLKRFIVINSDVIENISTITFFYKLVYLYGSKSKFVQYDYITLLQTDHLQYSNMPFNIKTEIALYYLILTRYYVETNAKELAFKTFQKIDTRYQFACSSDFFEKEYELLSNTINPSQL